MLAGEPALESMIKSYDERFANRMDFGYKLHGLTKKEVEKYLEKYEVDESAFELSLLSGPAMGVLDASDCLTVPLIISCA